MKSNNSLFLIIVLVSFSFALAKEAKVDHYLMYINYVGSNLSLKYVYHPSANQYSIIQINGAEPTVHDEKLLIRNILKLQDYLEKRPVRYRIKIEDTVTLDSERFNGITVIGGMNDYLYLFEKNAQSTQDLYRHLEFLISK
jgi:hypothetical protein